MLIHDFSVNSTLNNFRSFIRAETCTFVSGIAVSGYMIFNPINASLLYVMLSVFLITGASYAYNNITDREEDLINNRKLNYFVTNRCGCGIVVGLVVIGLAFSAMLPGQTLALYLLMIPLIWAYSGLRIKGLFLIKNLYTGLTICITFLMGALAFGIPGSNMIIYMPSVFLFGFTLNLLGDIRGVAGDMATGVRTIPVVYGIPAAKKVVYASVTVFTLQTIALGIVYMHILIPFMLAIAYFVHKDNKMGARASVLLSFSSLPLFIFILNSGGF